MTLFIVMAIYF